MLTDGLHLLGVPCHAIKQSGLCEDVSMFPSSTCYNFYSWWLSLMAIVLLLSIVIMVIARGYMYQGSRAYKPT